MTNYRETAFQRWGQICHGCGIRTGLEVDHIDGNRNNNNPNNLMPLCGTCHNLKTAGHLQIDPTTRTITVNFLGLFELTPCAEFPRHQVQIQLMRFRQLVPETWELTKGWPFALQQDGKSQAYFFECHVAASRLAELFDFDAVLDPADPENPESEDYRLNRELVEFNEKFRQMQADAELGRPFADIVVELNTDYRPNIPLKILAGQHRARAIVDAVNGNKELDRLHGVRAYVDINRDQRAEISLISNTNIAIAKALIDRFGEQQLGSRSRDWCQSVGLLERGHDFADRVTGQERFTVQIMRALVINYFRGSGFQGNIEEADRAYHERVYLPRAGALEPDLEYKRLLEEKPDLWSDAAFTEAGRQFANLNMRQVEACETADDAELRVVAFRYKAMTPTVAAAWAYTAGVLKRSPTRLRALFALYSGYDRNTSGDPLNTKAMTRTRHVAADPPTYRGLGTRQNTAEAQRLVEVFLLVSKPDYRGTITRQLLDLAVQQHVSKTQERDRHEREQQALRAARQIRQPGSA